MTKLLKCAGIYVLTLHNTAKCYVGKDTRLGSRAERHLALKEPDCPAIHKAIKKYGRNAFDVELIHYPNISDKALREVERWKIKQFGSHKSKGGYNLTWGGEGFDSETSRETQRKRVADGTHPFLGSEFARENNRKRVEAGTHPFLDSEFARENSLKRLKNGTHPFLGSKSSRERVKNGTHNFLGGEIQREMALKRVEDGTHPFLDPQFHQRRVYTQKIKRKNRRREFYRWVSVILTAKSVCEERIYQKRTREGFFDKEIPNMSNAGQLSFIS